MTKNKFGPAHPHLGSGHHPVAVNSEDQFSIFPGENFFLYWKTSASLWEEKLKELRQTDYLFVPINWGFHHEHPDQFDFGHYRPETNLKRIYEICQKIGKKVLFLMPINPSPLFARGGGPAFLPLAQALDKNLLAMTMVDQNGQLIKINSWYQPAVFQHYQKFCWQIGQHFSQTGMTAEVAGFESGYQDHHQFVSYLSDRSASFQKGFSRYLQKQTKKDENLPGSESGNEYSLSNFLSEDQLTDNAHEQIAYQKMISKLYSDLAKENLSGNWVGQLKFNFLGGHPRDIFNRFQSRLEFPEKYLNSYLQSFTEGCIPASVLLPNDIKTVIQKTTLTQLIGRPYVEQFLEERLYDEDQSTYFMPLQFFAIYDSQNNVSDKTSEGVWDNIGLLPYLNENFKWAYKIKNEIHDSEIEKAGEYKGLFIASDNIQEKELRKIFKLFMNGGKIFFLIDGLRPELKRKIEVFFIENKIDRQMMNIETQIEVATLGEGRLILIADRNLEKNDQKTKQSFWKRLMASADVKHLSLEDEKGVSYFWRSRLPNGHELKYEEIRRISIYNPSSYKKTFSIPHIKNFAFIKIIDENLTQVTSNPSAIQVQMLPGGSVSLDFGYFE